MKIKTSRELYQEHLEKGTSAERILEIMINRADRYQEQYLNASSRICKLQEKHRNLLCSTGRLINVTVDHIAKDNWGSYIWYKNRKYRYEGNGIWKKYVDKGGNSPHYMAQHVHGKFKVKILLSEEDMPEVFLGKCTGSVFGEKVITAKGHMICYGDEFELRKVKNNG